MYIYIMYICIYKYINIYAFNSCLVEEINEDELADSGDFDNTDTDDEENIN